MSRAIRCRTATLVALLSLTPACLADDADDADDGDDGAAEAPATDVAALGNAVVDFDTPLANATVALGLPWSSDAGYKQTCTGTLVTPSFVLTAAHCLGPYEPFTTFGQISAATAVGTDVLFAASGRDRFRRYPLGDTYAAPWVDDVPLAGVRALGGGPDTAELGAGGGTLYGAFEGGALRKRAVAGGAWVADGLVGFTPIDLAASPTAVWALRADGAVYRRPRAGDSFAPLLSMPDAIAIASDHSDRLYVATRSGALFVWDAAAAVLRPAGVLPGLTALDGDGLYLYARTGGGVLRFRRATLWDSPWGTLSGTISTSALLAASANELHVATGSTAARRIGIRRVTQAGALPRDGAGNAVTVVGLAVNSTDLFAIDDRLVLWAQPRVGGAWVNLGAMTAGSSLGVVTGFTITSGRMWISTTTGLWSRRGDRLPESWARIDAGEFWMVELTSADGMLYGVQERPGDPRRLWRRPALTAETRWTLLEDGFAESSLVVAAASKLWAFEPRLPRPRTRSFGVGPEPLVNQPMLDEIDATTDRTLASPMYVLFGRDSQAWPVPSACGATGRCRKARVARVTGEADLALLKLDAPVPAALATPTPPQLDNPFANPDDWATQGVNQGSWGWVTHPPDDQPPAVLRRRGTAGWADVTTPAGPWRTFDMVELEVDAGIGFVLSDVGQLWRVDASFGWTQVPLNATNVVGMAVDLGQVFVASTTRVGMLTVAGTQTLLAAPPLGSGEALETLAASPTALYATTTTGALLRFNRVTSAWTRLETWVRAQSLGADASGVVMLGHDGVIYQRSHAATSWSFVETNRNAVAVDQDAGAIFALEGGTSRWRRRGSGTAGRYPATGSDGVMVYPVVSSTPFPGSSGGPLYWTSGGTRRVLGAAQGFGPTRYSSTMFRGRVDVEPKPNIADWLRLTLGL